MESTGGTGTINQSRKALHGIRLIRKYFNKEELKQLLTSRYFSILYYNSKIWHIPSLQANLKQHLKAASANALKLLGSHTDLRTSYDALHRFHKRALPEEKMKFKHAIQLFKNYNDDKQNETWLNLNFQQNFGQRQNTVYIYDISITIL